MTSDDLDGGSGERERLRTEVARLSAELDRSRQREATLQNEIAASAEVLRTIASSPTDAQPVLDAVVESAMRLSNSSLVGLNIREGDMRRIVARASDGSIRVAPDIPEVAPLSLRAPGTRAMAERRTIHIPDRS